MSRSGQLSVRPLPAAIGERDQAPAAHAEHAARRALRGQIARLERELSQLVADCFPDVAPHRMESARHEPRLLGLAELERERDGLVARLSAAEAAASERAERHCRGRELLAAMQLEPARYKFVRLRAVDAGESGCGIWEVRPRLGLIGMLAGWWRVKLSSGCPLERGRAAGAARSHDRRFLHQPWAAHTRRPHGGEHLHERPALTLGHRADRLLL